MSPKMTPLSWSRSVADQGNHAGTKRWLPILIGILALAFGSSLVLAAEDDANSSERNSEHVYTTEVQPLLAEYCYDCHGYGEQEGGLALDQFESPQQAIANPDLWWRVVKNLRAGVMPPADYGKLSDEEEDKITDWVKSGPFGINPDDPGPITVRRLNRQEYGNTIRTLMGVRFDEKIFFPPDDSGHGFDNLADALMVSPLLMEKYLHAAELVVDRAVPKVTRIIPRQD